MKQKFVCSGCGTPVLKYLSQLTRTDIVFCSLACRNRNYKRVTPGWTHSSRKQYLILCQGCGVEFILDGQTFTKNRRYCSKRCRAKYLPRQPHSLATKAKLSIKAAEQNRLYKGKFLYEGPQGRLYMRSSWEVLYAKWLDSRSEAWTYEPRFILSNGYAYLPDFQLSSGVIIEVKGYMRPDAAVKWHMFEVEYPEITKHLLQNDDLKKLGILT